MPLRKARSSFKLLPLSGSYYGGKEAMLSFIQQNRFVCVCLCVCVCMTSKLFNTAKGFGSYKQGCGGSQGIACQNRQGRKVGQSLQDKGKGVGAGAGRR